MKDQYGELLKQYNLLKDPLDINDWEEEVTKWPKTHIGHVFSYILEMKAFSTEYVGQYKVRKAYSYFKSGFVHEIFTKSVREGNILLLYKVEFANQKGYTDAACTDQASRGGCAPNPSGICQ